MSNRLRTVRLIDMMLIAALLITSGTAVLLLFVKYYQEDEAEVAELPTLAPTLTPTSTRMSTATATATPTFTPWPTPFVEPLALNMLFAGEPVTITGETQPGDSVFVYDAGALLASVTAGDDGAWQVELAEGLEAGTHSLSVVAINAEGQSSESAPVGFAIGVAPSATPTATLIPTATRTPTSTATVTATATRTPTNTATRTPTNTATPTSTATLTLTATRTPTQTPTRTRTATQTPTPRPSDTPVPSPTTTSTATASPTETATPTQTPNTAAILPTGTDTPTATQTAAPTDTPRPTATQTSTPRPTATPTATMSLAPVIEAPESGDVVSPGPVVVSGSAPPSAQIEVQDAEAGVSLGNVATATDGTWQITVTVDGTETVTLIAVGTGPDGAQSASDPVTIRLAPPIQPNTGVLLGDDPEETGRTFTALIALLLVASGFGAIVAGRLLYFMAKSRTLR